MIVYAIPVGIYLVVQLHGIVKLLHVQSNMGQTLM